MSARRSNRVAIQSQTASRSSLDLEPVQPPAKKRKARARNASASSSKLTKQKQSGSGKGESSEDTVDDDIPTLAEWNDKSKFVRYKTCQLSGQKWEVGDFVEIAGQAHSGESDIWLARILHIRASGTSRVYCQVAWIYRSLKDLIDANCRNPPASVHFPEEVVMGEGDHATAIMSVQCINDSADVIHFDETNPLQEPIPEDAIFFRSVLRLPTEAEVKNEKAAAEKLKGVKKANKLWNAKFPIHEFDAQPTCICKRRYVPVPLDTEPMILCPRSSCQRWFHLACIRNTPHKKTNKDLLGQVTESGLDYLEADQDLHGEYLIEEDDNADSIAVTNTVAPNDLTQSARNSQGIPLTLITAAQSYISRGTAWAGIVGDARRVLEARALLQDIYKQIEYVEGTPSTSKRAKQRPSRSQENCEERLDAATRSKLKLWLEKFGNSDSGVREGEGDSVVYNECPSCYGVI